MSRRWPIPQLGQTIHVVGDTQSASPARQKIVLDDLATMPDVAHRVQVGDLVGGTGNPDWFPEMVTFMDNMGTGQWWACVGNHDYDYQDQDPPPSDAPPLMGMPGLDFVVDLDYVVLIFTYARAAVSYDPEPYDTTWLDQQLTDYAGRTCFIIAHPSLIDVRSFNESISPDTTAIMAVLAQHDNAKAWISGHTHTVYTTPGIVQSLDVGGRQIAHINASALYYTAPSPDWDDPLATCYLTALPDRLEVRYRDHGAHQWVCSGSEMRVWTHRY